MLLLDPGEQREFRIDVDRLRVAGQGDVLGKFPFVHQSADGWLRCLVAFQLNVDADRDFEDVFLLRLLDVDLEPFGLRLPFGFDEQFRIAGPFGPVVEEAFERQAVQSLERFAKVRCLGGLIGHDRAVTLETSEEVFVAQSRTKHVQNPRAFWIHAVVKHRTWVWIMSVDDRSSLRRSGPCGDAVFQHVPVSFVTAQSVLCPQRFAVRGKAFVEPQVRPVFARDEIAPPLMSQFVSDQPVGSAVDDGAFVVQSSVVKRRRAGVLHPAERELLDDDLRVLVPRVLDTESLAEEIEHRFCATERSLNVGLSVPGDVIRDGFSSPFFGRDAELSGDQRDQVGHVLLFLFPVKRRLPCC